MFKPLEQARVTLDNLMDRNMIISRKDAPVVKSCKIFYQDNFTGALVNNKFLGMTKRHPSADPKSSRLTGQCHAINRAVKALIDDVYGE